MGVLLQAFIGAVLTSEFRVLAKKKSKLCH
jgi:hypothetical protein